MTLALFADRRYRQEMRRTMAIVLRLPAVAILALIGGAAPAPGQAPAPSAPGQTSGAGNLERLLASRPVVNQTLTLDQAVAVSLRESPVVRGAAEEVQAALGRLN